MAIKLDEMTEQEVESIAEAFADYPYEDGERGLFYLMPDKEAVRTYISAFVRAGLKCGWLYTTSEKREGYIMISDSRSRPSLPAVWETITGCVRALGLKGSVAFIKAIKGSGTSLEETMKKQKKDFIKLELVVVTKPYQGQGYMRQVVDIAFEMGRKRGLPCILDTDAVLKKEKYCHLGMQHAGTRKLAEGSCLYDLIKPAEENGGV